MKEVDSQVGISGLRSEIGAWRSKSGRRKKAACGYPLPDAMCNRGYSSPSSLHLGIWTEAGFVNAGKDGSNFWSMFGGWKWKWR